MQNGAAQGRWKSKMSKFLTILNIFCFLQKLGELNWPSSGSENWMQNIILKFFGKKYFRKIAKWWCSKPKTIKNLNFTRSAILKIIKKLLQFVSVNQIYNQNWNTHVKPFSNHTSKRFTLWYFPLQVFLIHLSMEVIFGFCNIFEFSYVLMINKSELLKLELNFL